MRLTLAFLLVALAACQHAGESPSAPSSAESAYAGDESRAIKALSADQVQGYLAGEGLGYAKAAELNGYPGPRHVLDLAEALSLTPDQHRRVEGRFQAMQAEAQARGKELVDAEAALDRLFAEGRADRVRVRTLAENLAVIEGQIRAVHLEAHLDMVAVLTPEQVAAYNRLRGYESAGAYEGSHRHH